jgi:hypothetical protein
VPLLARIHEGCQFILYHTHTIIHTDIDELENTQTDTAVAAAAGEMVQLLKGEKHHMHTYTHIYIHTQTFIHKYYKKSRKKSRKKTQITYTYQAISQPIHTVTT